MIQFLPLLGVVTIIDGKNGRIQKIGIGRIFQTLSGKPARKPAATCQLQG
jgi:hypothetical protein